jgi:putative transposase
MYFARKSQAPKIRQTRAAVGGYSDAALVEQIRLILATTAVFGRGLSKGSLKMRYRGVRTSRGREMRLMREHGLQSPTRSGRVSGPRSHDGTILPAAPDLRCGTDLTETLDHPRCRRERDAHRG